MIKPRQSWRTFQALKLCFATATYNFNWKLLIFVWFETKYYSKQIKKSKSNLFAQQLPLYRRGLPAIRYVTIFMLTFLCCFTFTVTRVLTPDVRTRWRKRRTRWRRGSMSTERTLIPPRARKSCWPSSQRWPSLRYPRGLPTPDVDWRRRTRWRGG